MKKQKRFAVGIMAFIMTLTIMTSAVGAALAYDYPCEKPLDSIIPTGGGDWPPAYPWD
ncbi:MAG: hypothetical protein FWC76_05180 [Defluviitaleaceae bacterium]|nr:hypothetical protein [Defluviitaleaceae bacterium]